MGRKSVVHSYDIFDGLSINMNASWTSNLTNVEQLDKVAYHIKWAEGPTGEFFVDARNGKSDPWFVLAFAVPMAILATDNETQIVLLETPFTDIRVRWVPSNAVDTVPTGRLTAKVLGA